MTATSNTMIAKIFAALAVAGLVVSSFAAFVPANAQTTTTTTTTTSASVTFSRDLTVGSTGADVTALQNWLISKSFAIAAGATGYFGAQTQAALAKYQAANGISPAAGYFGPITRAKVNAGGSTSGGTGTGTGTGSSNGSGLSGGEADLSDFNLRREEANGDEGAEMVEVFTAEFDVEDGDVRVERMEITASSTNNLLETNPWDYFENVYVIVDGDEVADMDVSDRDAWDEEDVAGPDDQYTLNLTNLDIVVDEGDTAKITVAFDIASSIDTDDLAQDFVFSVKADAVRAVDSEGIQQYTGSNSESVSFGFGAEENGDLQIKSNSDDPDASILVADDQDESEEYTVFIFDIENDGDVDSLITEIEIDVNETGSGSTTDEILSSAMLVVDGDEYDGDIATTVDGNITFEDLEIEIGADEELTFELVVTLVEDAPTSITALTFDADDADSAVEAEGLDSGDDADVEGSATSASHTIALTGVVVEAVSTSQSVSTPGDNSASTTATFTVKFDVTALEEDAYVSSTTATSSSDGIVYSILGDSFTGTVSSIITSTATLTSNRYLVEEGETETFTLTVTVNPASAGTFYVRLDEVNFNDANAAGDTLFSVDSSNEDFRTDPIYVAN